MNETEDFYPCVGICQADPDSGYCLGCGRPPLSTPEVSVSVEASGAAPNAPIASSDKP